MNEWVKKYTYEWVNKHKRTDLGVNESLKPIEKKKWWVNGENKMMNE